MSKSEEDDLDLEEIPPIGFAFVLGLTTVILGSNGFYETNLEIFSGLVLATVAVTGFIGYKMKEKYENSGLIEAIKWSVEPIEEHESSSSSGSSGNDDKTPPAPEKMKNEIYFERADKKCEWCGDQVDSPDVHHIKPREEGGKNKKSNLIILCPTCHRKADRGAISRSKLRYQVRKDRDES